MKLNHPYRITVALRMAGIAGQDKLNGIFEHLSNGHRWQLSIFRTAQEFTGETVLREIDRGSDGFIVGIPDAEDALEILSKSSIPTVIMNVNDGNIEKRNSNIAFVKVAQHLKISYSLLNLRFNELMHESVYETILKFRLKSVQSILKSSDEPIELIAEKCGWASSASLKKIFKERFKMSMRDYRASFN